MQETYNFFCFVFSASEMTVTRGFPVATLLKEKKVTSQYSVTPTQVYEECWQLRSSTFQVGNSHSCGNE